MEKTKLGLSVGIVSAATYLVVQFGGYTPALLLVGYILLCETNSSLKTSALTAAVVMLGFSAVNVVVNLLPNLIGIVDSLVGIFGAYVHLAFIDSLANFAYNVLSLAKTLVMVLLAVMALMNKPIELPFIKKLVG